MGQSRKDRLACLLWSSWMWLGEPTSSVVLEPSNVEKGRRRNGQYPIYNSGEPYVLALGTIVLCVGSTVSDKVERKPVVGKEDNVYGCCYVVVNAVSNLDSWMEVQISGF
ncbi:hypothetical protein VNO80_20111 [Phaseolus coccineus]|uniref:Uncharacterized protein n=1 Tax=Phaseolus coccineus TaxID=3886 RepID=A0AAN9MHF3_PHACN